MNKKINLYKIFTATVVLASLFSSCKDDISNDMEQGLPKQEVTEVKTENVEPFFQGKAYIKFKEGQQPVEGFRAATISPKLAKKKLSLKPVFDIESDAGKEMWGEWAEAIKAEGLDRWYEADFDKSEDVKAVTKELRNSQAVEYAEPVLKLVPARQTYRQYTGDKFRAQIASSVNTSYGGKFDDPLLSKQWHYQTEFNYGLEDRFVKGADINLFKAWDKTKGRPEVIVAIIDSGIDTTHPDLIESLWVGPKGENGHDFVEDDATIEPGYHGTHVAGTVAARNNNGKGGGGVAGGNGTLNSGVRLMSCQVYGKDDAFGNAKPATPAGFGKAFVWAATRGAVVANCSWGFPARTKNNDAYLAANMPHFEIMKEGINFFLDYAGHRPDKTADPNAQMEGGVVLVASGNDGAKDIDVLPSSYDRVIAVGAFNSKLLLTDYTNTGKWVDILAPGGETPIGSDMNEGILSTVPADFINMSFGDPKDGGFAAKQFIYPGYDNRYAYAQGTSMATPHVTGIAALMVSYFGGKGKGFKADELRQRLLGAVKKVDHEGLNPKYRGKIGVGYIDAFRALEGTIETIAPKPVGELKAKDIKYYDTTISWLVPADEDAFTEVAYAYDIYLAKGNKPSDLKGKPTANIFTGDKSLGDEITYIFRELEANTEYTVTIITRDSFGNKSKEAQSITFTTKENKLPHFINRPSKPIQINEETPYCQYTFEVKDEDPNQTWTYTLSLLPKGVSVKRIENKLLVNIDIISLGDFSFDVSLEDNLGGVYVERVSYSVVRSEKYNIIEADDINLAIGATKTMSVKDILLLKNGMPQGYTTEISLAKPNVAKVERKGDDITIRAMETGATTVFIQLKNEEGKLVSKLSFQVTVASRGASPLQEVYPKTAHSYIKLRFVPGIKTAEVVITNRRGRVMISKVVEINQDIQEAMLSVDKLAPAVYNILVKTEGTISKRTFIKN